MLGIWGGGPVKFRALRDTPPPTGLCGEAAFPAPHTHSGKGLPRTCSPPSRRQLGFLDVATPSQRLGAAVEGAPRPPPRACFETHLHSRGGRDGAAPGAPTPLASLGEAGAGSEGGARARGCKHRRGKWGRVCVGGGGGRALQLRRLLPRGAPKGSGRPPRPPDPGRSPPHRARRTYPSNSNSRPRTPATASKTSFSCCRLSTTGELGA